MIKTMILAVAAIGMLCSAAAADLSPAGCVYRADQARWVCNTPGSGAVQQIQAGGDAGTGDAGAGDAGSAGDSGAGAAGDGAGAGSGSGDGK